jgi:hypothetical protein
MLLRCRLDELLLEAWPHPRHGSLVALDGDEAFEMERIEALYYELVAATPDDLNWLEETGYRCLRLAPDFSFIPMRRPA